MIQKLFLSLFLLFQVGCDSSTSNNNINITSGEQINSLGTLGEQSTDLKNIISKESWKKIVVDLDKFYPTAISTVNKAYKVDITFKYGRVTAFADCQKLTARYKIVDNALSFSRISYAPAVDMASCVEFEDADQAVYQFFSNTFEATGVEKDEIVFTSDDFDAKVVLQK